MSDAAAPAAATPDTSMDTSHDADGSEAGQEGQAKTPEVPEYKRQKHKYKALGQEYEVDYDELVKRAEKGHGAEKRLAEAAKLEKDIKGRLEKLKNPDAEDFDELIDLIGFDKAQKFAEKLMWDKITWDELPEHEKRARLAQQRADEAERKLQEREQREQEEHRTKLQQQAFEVIEKEISQVLEEGKKSGLSVADIPDAKELIIDEMIAYLEYVDQMEESGQPIRQSPPSHADVLRKIQEQFDTRSSAYLKRLSAEQLTKVLTKEQLAALRQQEIDQLYAPIPQAGRSKNPQDVIDPFAAKPSKKAQRVMRTDDYFKKMDERFGG